MDNIFQFAVSYIVSAILNFPPLIVFILADKGGVGKSVLAQLIRLALGLDDRLNVKMVDTDFSNSSSVQIFSDTKMVDLKEKAALGAFSNLVAKMREKELRHVVVDVGAREEKLIRALLPTIVRLIKAIGGRVVILRPITLGSHTQKGACEQMKIAQELSIPVVFVVNQGQGREEKYFEAWNESKSRAQAIELGAVETFITDAGIQYVDDANGFGLTLEEVAFRDFRKVSEQDRADAEQRFTLDDSAWLLIWLHDSMKNLVDAVKFAIDKRDTLDSEAGDEADKAAPTPAARPSTVSTTQTGRGRRSTR